MASATKEKEKNNWILPFDNDRQPTLTEYPEHIKEAENSGFISFEEFEKKHTQWEAENL